MCSYAAFNERSSSTETDHPAPVRCWNALRPLLSVQFFVQPCPCLIGSLCPLSPVSRSYGGLLRCLWPSPEEGVALGVGFWNRGYPHINPIQYDTNDGRTLCSWRVRKRLPITMVSYRHALHGTWRASVRTQSRSHHVRAHLRLFLVSVRYDLLRGSRYVKK